ncbi:MEDS domain-containing protein [Embleya scabrispora]|uniref:MEDS domain-containing protein n=1 Tax=Embleya scabrispora TaxID=159449 RepID=UPI000370FF27|nr:MEDS domain-containing protein [Embleya scabrispora]MYS79094.1 STAS domain-containing protein [Streptomyces sp. SID5474]
MDTSQAGATVAAVGSMAYGSHCCFVSADEEIVRLAVHSYVRDGLSADDRVLCLLGRRDRTWLMSTLSEGPAWPAEREADGSLVVVDVGATPLWEGEFSPEGMAQTFFAAVEQALADGFRGLRVCGDMTWGRAGGVAYDDLHEFERLAGLGLPGRRAMGFCLYDPREFSSVQVDAQESLHPLVAGTGRARPPSLQVTDTTKGLRLIGEADVATRALLEEALRRATAAQSGRDLVVDLSALEFADLGAMESLYRTAAALGPDRRLVLRAAGPAVRKVLDLLGWSGAGGLVVDGDRPSGERSGGTQ